METADFKSKDSLAQIEVWEMKHALYNEIKDIPRSDRLKYIIDKAEKVKNDILSKKMNKELKLIID